MALRSSQIARKRAAVAMEVAATNSSAPSNRESTLRESCYMKLQEAGEEGTWKEEVVAEEERREKGSIAEGHWHNNSLN